MDLYELRLDQPHPGTRDGDPGHGRVCQLPHPPRARAGRAPGAGAGTASRDESSMSDRARAQVTKPEALPDQRLTDAAVRPTAPWVPERRPGARAGWAACPTRHALERDARPVRWRARPLGTRAA